jgi:Gpi18-like mannosyltransferase
MPEYAMTAENGTCHRSGSDLARLLVLYKTVCFLLIGLSIVLLPPIFAYKYYIGNVHLPEISFSKARFFQTWDAQHYLLISRYGYGADPRANVCFPLWPFCIRFFSYLTGGNHLLSGLILANLFSIVALVLLYRFIEREKDAGSAERTLMLMLAFPGAIFLLFPYSEPLFFLLSMVIFILLKKDDYLKAGLVSFLAALTRPVGVLWIVPFAVHILRKRKPSALAYTSLTLLGYICYLGIMYVSTGNAFSAFASEGLFLAHASIVKLFDPAGFIRVLTSAPNVHSFIGSAIDRTWFFIFVVTLFPLWKRDKVMFAYSLVMGLVPALTLSLMAFTRYSLMLIPSFMVAGDFFAPAARKGSFYLTLAALFGLQVIFLIRHINFYWVG